MKKVLIVLTAALILTAISATGAFAENVIGPDEKSEIKSMFDSMRSWAQQAEENGEITKDEAKEWDKHFKSMEKYHKQNGFSEHCGGAYGDDKETGYNMMGTF